MVFKNGEVLNYTSSYRGAEKKSDERELDTDMAEIDPKWLLAHEFMWMDGGRGWQEKLEEKKEYVKGVPDQTIWGR